VTDHQLDLFGGSYTPAAPAMPRPAVPDPGYAPEFVHAQPGVWAICVYAMIPKQGFEHLHFPHYFGGPPDCTRWRVARHAELPVDTFIFDTRAEAAEITALVFGGATNLRHWMARVEVPSDDHRRRN
jgi:hypothetical protein